MLWRWRGGEEGACCCEGEQGEEGEMHLVLVVEIVELEDRESVCWREERWKVN